jgi:hypothetical protein
MSSRPQPIARLTALTPATLLLWLLAAVAVAWFLWRVLLPSAGYASFGFPSYYTSAQLVLAGELDARIYDDAWFQAQERQRGLRDDIYGTQPPTMALLMLPVAWLPPATARAVWLALDLLWLALIGLLALRSAAAFGVHPTASTVPLMLILVASFPPLRAELRYAQVHTLMALWYALWLYGFVTRRAWLCGLALALLAMAKLAGAPLWLVLLAAQRWRAFAWAVGLTLAGLLVTLPLVGLDTWQAYLFGRVGDLGANPVFGVTALQTLASLLRQLFVYDPSYTPAPLLNAPLLAIGLWIALAAACVGRTVLGAQRHAPLLTGAAALCFIAPLQPAGEQHHYVMLLTPLFVALLLAPWLMPATPLTALPMALGAALLLAPSYFLDNAAWAGWPRALLAYPRVYGALLIWGGFMLWRAALASQASPAPTLRGAP